MKNWLEQLLEHLESSGEVGQATRQFLRERNVTVRVRSQPTGARWTLFGNIEISPAYSDGKDDDYALSLIVHEARHLRQGFLTALSVHGELDAWQIQFVFLKALTGNYYPASKLDGIVEELVNLNPTDRVDLLRAGGLMQSFSGKKYRIDLLPLYPLGKEIAFRLSGQLMQ
ncbi:MAG: hypothetical protein HYZ23_00875 [Chloroflexi bacterium]|nr:hypothetical protein [Chloroflexota bacterium]